MWIAHGPESVEAFIYKDYETDIQIQTAPMKDVAALLTTSAGVHVKRFEVDRIRIKYEVTVDKKLPEAYTS